MTAVMEKNRIKLEFDVGEFQKEAISFLSLLEEAGKSQMSDEQIEVLSEDIKSNWWKENKDRFLSENRN